MGHKVHPTGFRLGVIKEWQSKWYSDTHYAEFVQEDNKLREDIRKKYPEASISLIEIDRQAKDVTLTLHTARPGIVIGRGGQRVEEMRQHLEGLIGKKIRLNIQEVRQPELDAYLVARSVADQIVRRVAYRRAMKQAIFRTLQSGAKGIKISCAGRLANAEIARRQTSAQGQVPLHTLRADIDYGFTEAHTTLGRIGVKVWIYKGQVLPELVTPETEAKPEAAPPAAPPVVDTQIKEKLAEAAAAAAVPAPVEEKPAKPKAKKVTRPTEEKPAEAAAAPAVAEEKPAEAAAAPAVAEEKPAKPKAQKAIKARTAGEKPAKAKAAEEKPAKAEKPVKTEKPAAAKAEEAAPAPKRRKKAEPTAEVKETKPTAEKKAKEPPRKKEKEA
jgi:small subunit ribosomal protein S3